MGSTPIRIHTPANVKPLIEQLITALESTGRLPRVSSDLVSLPGRVNGLTTEDIRERNIRFVDHRGPPLWLRPDGTVSRTVEELADVVRRAESVPKAYEQRVEEIAALTVKLVKALRGVEVAGVVSTVELPEPVPTRADISYNPFDTE